MRRMSHRGGVLSLLAISAWLTGAAASQTVRADDGLANHVQRTVDEVDRPKAQAPLRFFESFHEARAEAERSGRRIFAYFSGPHCGWCRELEKRTLTDAEVVDLSHNFICVKLDAEKEPRLFDKLSVDAIPRSFILNAKGERLDMIDGYRPPTEYAEWLRAGLAKPLTPFSNEPKRVPSAVGASEAEAGLLVWFVDGPRTMKRWADPKAFDHPQLLQILRASGTSPRVEHMAFSDLPTRWDRAAAAKRLPDLIASEKVPASVRELERQGRLRPVVSHRLSWLPGRASCPDFAGPRQLHVLQGGPHEQETRQAVDQILKPGPETHLRGPRLSAQADPAGAESVARRAIVNYMEGHARRLKDVASEASPQLARCTNASAWRRGLRVDAGAIELRGGKDLAFAKVEVTYRGKEIWGADPFLVVLRRESSQWKAFAVTDDIETWKWLPDLLILLKPRDDAQAPAAPKLIWPEDRARLPDLKRPLTWQLPVGGERIVAQICMLMSEEVQAEAQGESWPYTTLLMCPGVPHGGSVPTSRFTTPAHWCVWSIGASGTMSISEVRSYQLVSRVQ